MISNDIPLPRFSDPQWAAFRIKENLTIDAITGKGRTFIVDPQAQSYYYPIEECHLISALAMMSPFSFDLSYSTNMSVAVLTDTSLFIDILRPFFQDYDIQHLALTLNSIVLPFSSCDLLRIGEKWRHLHCIELRFHVVPKKAEEMTVIDNIKVLTRFCPVLDQLLLPELNLLGFTTASPDVSSYSLNTLTSSILLSCNKEANKVASALLSLFPNLRDVVVSDFSAVGWSSIGKEICDLSPGIVHNLLVDDTPMRLAAALITPITEEDFQLALAPQVRPSCLFNLPLHVYS